MKRANNNNNEELEDTRMTQQRETRKRKRPSDLMMNEVLSTSWVDEFYNLEHKAVVRDDTSGESSSLKRSSLLFISNSPSLTSSNSSHHLVSTMRLKRLFRQVQNVTRHVAIHVLESVENWDLFQRYRTEFVQWGVLCVAEQLRDILNMSHQQQQQQQSHSSSSSFTLDTSAVAKRRRMDVCEMVERERQLVRMEIEQQLEYLIGLKSTAYDDLVEGIVESFRYHPRLATDLFQSAVSKNQYFYPAYLHSMEIYRQTGAKLDCVKALKYGKFMCESEIGEVEAELQVERSNFVKRYGFCWGTNDNETPLLRLLSKELNELKAMERVFQALVHFFSDGSAEDMFSLFHDALRYDPNSVYAFCNLGVLNAFNVNAHSETLELGVEQLKTALHHCNQRDNGIIASFLHHTIAQTYMRMNRPDDALESIEKCLQFNPTMILAFFDRATIHRNQEDYSSALDDNDKLLDIHPESRFELSNIYCSRAALHFILGQSNNLASALRSASSVDPANSFAYIMSSKQALMRNDMDAFEKLKDSFVPREQMHITTYLQHLADGYTKFGRTEQATNYKKQLDNYNSVWQRID